MIKTAGPPSSEAKANAKKAETDTLAAQLLDLDSARLKKQATRVANFIRNSVSKENARIVITGGAGSGKTTFAGALSKELKLKDFDLDEYVEGGHTADQEAYETRLHNAFLGVWQDLPDKTGWVIEHVEACHPFLVETFEPSFAILVDPGADRLKRTAEARNAVGKADPSREKRALETMKKAKKQFKALSGKEVSLSNGKLIVKKIES
jgi:GTPase SAR1 family protein